MTEQVTAAALIDAAMPQFAAKGFDGASLRAVMRGAQADPGSIHYHFGSRESLAVAVLERVLGPLNCRRLELLADAIADAPVGGVSLQRLIHAIVRPDVDAAFDLDGHDNGQGRLIGMIYLDRAVFVQDEVAKHFAPVAEQFMPHLNAALPNIPAHTLSWRVRWFVFGVLGAQLSDAQAFRELTPINLVARLVASASAALAAPVSEEGPKWK